MERMGLKDAVILTCRCGAEMTQQYCREVGCHWPHVVRVKMKNLQGEPEVVTVCPGDGGRRLMIAQRVGSEEKEWLVQDVVADRRAAEVVRLMNEKVIMHVYPYVDLEVEKYEGARRPCGSREPHYPHVTGTYHTVRGGWLDYYCPGWSGEGIVVYEDRWHGDAQMADESVFYVMRS